MAAGNTYVAIATNTLSSAASSVTFSSIPSTYTDLVLVMNVLGTASSYLSLQFNGDTTSNYSDTVITGYSGSAQSGRDANTTQIGFAWAGASMAGLWVNAICNLQNYSNATTYKTVISRFNSSSNEVSAGVGLWRNTAAINEIKVTTSTSTYASGSTFSLYGIAAA